MCTKFGLKAYIVTFLTDFVFNSALITYIFSMQTKFKTSQGISYMFEFVKHLLCLLSVVSCLIGKFWMIFFWWSTKKLHHNYFLIAGFYWRIESFLFFATRCPKIEKKPSIVSVEDFKIEFLFQRKTF